MAFQAQPASPVGVQLNSGMGRDTMAQMQRSDLFNLSKCKTWLADDTLSTYSKLFSQLWDIHGKVDNLVLSLVLYFLINKNQDTYVCALTFLKAKLDGIIFTLKEEPKKTRGRKNKIPS
ncbi:hypothetical protein DSO57_1036343 [Entomophthora muscae]|uniref:Uncharacterized protein n=1 Tax=Entomophthora muscae TaxID=34485 RepID=A0ACC2SCF1_9FUNG|nr:hypothetical protein DSO57_1036343 [Entomophthora muscae]